MKTEMDGHLVIINAMNNSIFALQHFVMQGLVRATVYHIAKHVELLCHAMQCKGCAMAVEMKRMFDVQRNLCRQ